MEFPLPRGPVGRPRFFGSTAGFALHFEVLHFESLH
jgi:hypothetical protein